MNMIDSIVVTDDLPTIDIPGSYNYIGVFLTLNCNLRCSYCINRFGSLARRGRMLTVSEWVRGLNRIMSRSDLPLSIQGGEPTLHPEFYQIINGIRPDFNIDLLTNLHLDVDTFMAKIPPSRIKRQAPYASIRVSYHPETMNFAELKEKILKLLAGGYSVGVWSVDHPAWGMEIARARAECTRVGIDFRVKEFLGVYQGRKFGTYRYANAVDNNRNCRVDCRTTELLIDPTGHIYRCHNDLYAGRLPIGNLLDSSFRIDESFRVCDHFGSCNPCDVKTKTNRFQQFGHTSVEIRFLEDCEGERGEKGGVC